MSTTLPIFTGALAPNQALVQVTSTREPIPSPDGTTFAWRYRFKLIDAFDQTTRSVFHCLERFAGITVPVDSEELQIQEVVCVAWPESGEDVCEVIAVVYESDPNSVLVVC